MNEIQKKVLNKLLDTYEKSKTFSGENKVNQTFSVNIGKMFPEYLDDSEYDFFCEVNMSLNEIEEQSLICLERSKKGTYERVCLNVDHIQETYMFLMRIPRRDEQEWLESVWVVFETRISGKEPLRQYIAAQRERNRQNQNIEYYKEKEGESGEKGIKRNIDEIHRDYEDTLTMALAVLENEEEIFIRDLSIKVFGNSKRAEQLQSKVQALLFQYGDFEEKKTVLEECGVVHTPTYVMMKGNGKIWLNDQMVDLSRLKGDIALSTVSLKELKRVEVSGSRIVTIENLTSFHDYQNMDDFIIYLGGFHNKIKREFILKLYEQHKEKEYRHFGDMDAGGYYILEHLKRKTGICFRSIYMDQSVLEKYMDRTVKLTANDRSRLQRLLELLNEQEKQGQLVEDYRDVICFMLEHNCKLEQEAVCCLK